MLTVPSGAPVTEVTWAENAGGSVRHTVSAYEPSTPRVPPTAAGGATEAPMRTANTNRPEGRVACTARVRPSLSRTDHDPPGPAIAATGTRSVTVIATPSGQWRCTWAVAMNGSASTFSAVGPGSTLISEGWCWRPAASTMAASLVLGWTPVTVTTRALNHGVCNSTTAVATSAKARIAPTIQCSRRRPLLRWTSARRWRIRGSIDGRPPTAVRVGGVNPHPTRRRRIRSCAPRCGGSRQWLPPPPVAGER